jgi:ketosteroid isomerase-like protein
VSRGNIETVRRACEAWNAGDISGYRDLYTHDVIAEGGALWPEGSGAARGPDAVIRSFESLMAAFEHSQLIPEGFIETGETLVVPLIWSGVPTGSRSVVEQRLVCIYRFRNRRIASTAWFKGLDEALDALGLPRSAAENLVADDATPQDVR